MKEIKLLKKEYESEQLMKELTESNINVNGIRGKGNELFFQLKSGDEKVLKQVYESHTPIPPDPDKFKKEYAKLSSDADKISYMAERLGLE